MDTSSYAETAVLQAFFYPLLSNVADHECCLSIPISKAWPEGGASALKRIKTRLRSRHAAGTYAGFDQWAATALGLVQGTCT